MAPIFSVISLSLLACNGAFAHPGHSAAQEALERAEFIKRNPKSVRSCASQLTAIGQSGAAFGRRRRQAIYARSRQGVADNIPMLARRDFSDYNFSHKSNKSVELGSDETLLFDDNSSCVLQPEVTQGPYYVDGELVRGDMSEDQPGVPLYLDIQLIDTSTCEPVPAVFVDLWHCNATGVYSGVSASGNGDSDSDDSNLDATFLRGIQQSDVNGVVQMETIFPGHYTGRATHIHILTHNTDSTTVRTNATILGSNHTAQSSHVGQIFFDQSLISKVEALSPYSDNTQTLTLNKDDDILASEADSMDPFVEYVLLGDKPSDGIMAWIRIGIDPTTDDSTESAATYYKTGGETNSNFGGGGPGGPNGTMPSGLPPSGSRAPPASTSSK